MEDLQTADINLPPEYITKHLKKIVKEFEDYKAQIDKELDLINKANKFIFDAYNFDSSGESHVLISSLTEADKRLMNRLSKKFSYENFLQIIGDKIYNRQQVYYSVLKDEPRIYQAIKTFIYLDSSLHFIQEIDKKDFIHGSFIIASVLDDIRYKLILLFEDVLNHEITLDKVSLEDLVKNAIIIYYSYILDRPQTTISYSQLIGFTIEVREFITEYLNIFNPDLGSIRRYKEGDIPSDNLLFIHKLKRNLPSENIDIIIGIRFGGIELPYIVKHFVYPKAKILLKKISNYSDKGSDKLEINFSDFKNKNILIVDDGITTGRTLQSLISILKNKCNNIYFACLYYSGAKRIKQMQMELHGGVNLEQLKKCCVLKESSYTTSSNKTSYTNRKGKFDKTKAKVEAKTELGQTLFDIEIPAVNPKPKDLNTKKVFIACSLSYISESYDYLIYIRNKFQLHPDYEIVDDWLVNRIEKDGNNHTYKEIAGRNFLHDAIKDIDRSHIVALFCPGPSAYISSLFVISAMKKKEIYIFYRRIDDIKDFKISENVKQIQIKQMKTNFIL
ncbi:MAG: phosphoribosyltransferase [Prolixibacteraceae bacterium]|nr:phosphoribosyltransferase [Prolixibacteraceae bacterium]